MSSEREEVLRALQQHLLGAAEQLGRLIEVEQQRMAFQSLADSIESPTDSIKAQAQVAEYNHAYWKAQTQRAIKPSVFDHCFHNAFPHWHAPKFVRTVRKQLGRFDELGAERLLEALQQYERQFGAFRKEHERVEAHKLAIEAVRDALTECVAG